MAASNLIARTSRWVEYKLSYFSKMARAERLLNRSRRLFDDYCEEYWKTIRRDRNATKLQREFDALERDGVCIIPNFVDAETLKLLRDEVHALPGYLEGRYEGDMPFKNFDSDGFCSLQVTPALPIMHRVTAENTELTCLAKALFGPEARLSAASLLNKYNPERIDSSGVPHWDDYRARLKAFLYLTDVGPENAPTIYLKGSHRGVPWRKEKDYASRFLPLGSAGGSWWPVEKLGFEKLHCTAPAGSLVLFDALGIHAATQLQKDRRVMVMLMYTTHLPLSFRPY
jgi:hypothetical protein